MGVIDADGLRRRIVAFCTGCSTTYLTVENIVMMINQADTVDAVPVVRRRDCKHLHMWDQKDRYAFCPKTNIVFSPFEKDIRTFFCSYGERRNRDESYDSGEH